MPAGNSQLVSWHEWRSVADIHSLPRDAIPNSAEGGGVNGSDRDLIDQTQRHETQQRANLQVWQPTRDLDSNTRGRFEGLYGNLYPSCLHRSVSA